VTPDACRTTVICDGIEWCAERAGIVVVILSRRDEISRLLGKHVVRFHPNPDRIDTNTYKRLDLGTCIEMVLTKISSK
jgi:hypothetical protein